MGALPLPRGGGDFLRDWLGPRPLEGLRECLGAAYPGSSPIFGQRRPAGRGGARSPSWSGALFEHVHGRRVAIGSHRSTATPACRPTPFPLKDWERYDVSRFVDPAASRPKRGIARWQSPRATSSSGRSRATSRRSPAGRRVERGLPLPLAAPRDAARPRGARRPAVDHVPLDVHVGSIAIRRFIEARQPRLTLHGHVHESARLTGSWQRPHRPDRLPLRRPRRPGAGPGRFDLGPARRGHPGTAVGPLSVR